MIVKLPLRFIALACAVAALGGCAAAPTRTELAQEAAVGVIAAVARGDNLETDHRLGDSRDSFDPDAVRRSLPSSFGVDPKMYSARIVEGNPEITATVAAVVRMDMVVPPDDSAYRVTMRWNPGKQSGDWDVTAIESER